MSKLSGTWHNQHGSHMRIEIADDGAVTGTFSSGTGFPDPDEIFPLTGRLTGGLVSFIVDFGKYDCITAWTGHVGVEEEERVLKVLWHMAVRVRKGGKDVLWTGIHAGADTFHRGPAARRPLLAGGRSHPHGPWSLD